MRSSTTTRILALGLLAMFACSGMLVAQRQKAYNEHEVRSQPSDYDKAGVWALDFRFKDPRLIKVNIPGRGTRICWYLWYQVINRSGKPRKFVPDFELVTIDIPGVHPDEVLPTVQDAIKKIEDPTGYQNIRNSVTIANEPIPSSKPDAFPRAITGVAIWDGTSANPDKRNGKDLSDATRFSIFVRGLSNGYVIVDPPDANLRPITRHKTLQLNFKRQGDRFMLDSREIRFVEPAQWIYRAQNISEKDLQKVDQKNAKK